MRGGWMLVVSLAAVLSAAGQRQPSPQPSPQPPWEKNRLRIGQSLYRENCVVCHDIDRQQSKKPGPSFYQLFKREKMPLSNTRPNRDYIKVRVKFGGPLMPAFRQTLSDSEINTLMDYMASK